MEPGLIIGLGNPGSRYAATRHNLGFRVVETLADAGRAVWKPGIGPYERAEVRMGGTVTLLAKPTTFMNRSGEAVAELLRRTGVAADRWLVVMDDLALPLGSLRLRPRGSDGGHNGLASVIEALGSTAFTRLRCGIGPAEPVGGEDLPGFVLSPFTQDEEQVVAGMVTRAADACRMVLESGLAAAMVTVNTK